MFTLILAGSMQEGLTFAKDVGLTRARIANSAAVIRGLRVAEVIELPSFWTRRDKHAILSEVAHCLRRDRKASHTYVDDWIHPSKRELPGQMTLDEALAAPPVIGDVVPVVESRRAPAAAAPTSVSAVKAARAARKRL